ncbi:unnamed protein product [Clonostachys rosea]|uniref:F-box domain-containing protein n=1 Tax=Bionectria ochroleuca TaxID=29856 RepID=A0ABY6UGL1_BIOOC|nr:unnamed protein product [Clonostachys rosea]
MSATEQALRLPELLLSVFELIQASGHSLVPIAQVNQVWFDCATSILWRRVKSRELYRVEKHRRQIYASKLDAICFDGEDGDIHEAFIGLQFHHIRQINLDLFDPPRGGLAHLQQYLAPSLQVFNFIGGDLDDEFLLQMAATCTRLRVICMNLPGPRVTPSAILSLVSGCERLEDVNFNDMEGLLSDAIFLHLAGRSNIFRLTWDTLIPPRLVTRASQETATPFKDMRVLTTTVTTSSVAWIAQNMTRLSHLILKLEDTEHDVLRPLPKLQNLKRIRISFLPTQVLSTESLVGLRSLSKLETLDLSTKARGMKVADVRGANFQNADFEKLLSGLPLLRHLSLVIEASFSLRVGPMISRNCPLIEECNILKNFDTRLLLAQAPADKPMFPFLQRLNIRRVTMGRAEENRTLEQSADVLIAAIRRNCPSIKLIIPSETNPYSSLVARRFDSAEKPADT